MDAQQRIKQLESKLKEQQARQFWTAKGGDANAWEGMKNTILQSLTLTTNDEIDQAQFDKALETIPGVHRHFGQQEEQEAISLTLPDSLGANGAWAVLEAQRAAASPRR